jgi:tRNA1Val (adenine37-N6)-methyltransferase
LNAHDETLDRILRGKLRIVQNRSGYRFSLDAILLWSFASLSKGAQVVDLGAGVGIVGILAAHKEPSARVTAIEIQKDLCDYAQKNVQFNGMTDRVRVLHLAVQDVPKVLPRESFDVALCNPPYGKFASSRKNPDPQKMHARHETLGRIQDFLDATRYLLRPQGKGSFIFKAARLTELLSKMAERRLEPRRLRMVHSTRSVSASMVLVEGVKDGRAELEVLPPLCVYRSKGLYSEEVARIFEGEGL